MQFVVIPIGVRFCDDRSSNNGNSLWLLLKLTFDRISKTTETFIREMITLLKCFRKRNLEIMWAPNNNNVKIAIYIMSFETSHCGRLLGAPVQLTI